ncbi:MAG: hypothetical protein WD712_02390 [Candidatus Spechtbacterales bacterium]
MHEKPELTPKDFSAEVDELREQTLKQMDIEVAERIKNNPNPTEEELLVGAFREELEPQVRDAIFSFFRKGYATESSGFAEHAGKATQDIDGYFNIDEETKNKLEKIGVSVKNGPEIGMPYAGRSFTSISFEQNTVDISEIKRVWDSIADMLPDLKKPSGPSVSVGSLDFIKKFAPKRADILKAVPQRSRKIAQPFSKSEEIENLKIALKYGIKYHPDMREVWQKRLKELEEASSEK